MGLIVHRLCVVGQLDSTGSAPPYADPSRDLAVLTAFPPLNTAPIFPAYDDPMV
jgi:hypothetical protein